jgi:hypothetical protein
MKERLIELIRQARKTTKGASCDLHREMLIADYLLANGVIVPPCKVGDTVYVIRYAPISQKYYIKESIAEVIASINGHFYLEYNGKKYMFGEKAFVNKEEAEKALAERLCEGRVSNDPVVIEVKAELKEMTGEQQ